MSNRNVVAKSLSVLTGLFVSYYSRNNIDFVYAGTNTDISADETKVFTDWLKTMLLKELKTSQILEGSSVLEILVAEDTFFYMRVFRPYTLVLGPFFMQEKDKKENIDHTSGIIRKALTDCPVLDLKFIRAVETFAEICAYTHQEPERTIKPEDRASSTEEEAMYMTRLNNEQISYRYKAERGDSKKHFSWEQVTASEHTHHIGQFPESGC